MKAIVVYESLWGNTEAIAHAIGDGLGSGTRVMSTSEATPEVIKDADFLVVGSPVMGFSVPNEKMIAGIQVKPGSASVPPDLSQTPMRTWLDALAPGQKPFAAFETRVKGPWGKATPVIEDSMKKLGYRKASEAQKFIVEGTQGPLKDGEIERARQWGAELSRW
ncbi:flavodoxin family protein [Dehalogenimonas etheniformans]|uniref:Flavodoxin n=1 Tax=Dehalogenimonas etheniformans TaxID=1536648 RepID=A0A2P5P6E1_9CHLR|nr:flavodoxin domain-containing protein [Dehalogenimonas etheniformans]PPD57863.1 flavodoxin [Dehalogenimonas etheniformans]QNT75484.1 flavodoxin domain-containing protein [Dehalogenimonas etheniformans]